MVYIQNKPNSQYAQRWGGNRNASNNYEIKLRNCVIKNRVWVTTEDFR